MGGGVGHEGEPDGGPARLGRGGRHRADADVVHARGAVDLRRRVRREADEPVRSHGRPRLGDGDVVLADVDAVGAGGRGQVRAVVDDEQRAVLVADRPHLGRGGEQLVVGRRLVAQLHDVDTPAQRVGQETGRTAVADEVETGLLQAFAPVHRPPSMSIPWGPTGARTGLRGRPRAADRQNLLRVMPAEGAMSTQLDAVIVGGGIIGLSIAHRATARGMTVAVLEAGEPGGGATNVAAGMLAPVTEASFGEEALLEAALESHRRWPAFAAELGVPLLGRGGAHGRARP